jgi:hypothetical protein
MASPATGTNHPYPAYCIVLTEFLQAIKINFNLLNQICRFISRQDAIHAITQIIR